MMHAISVHFSDLPYFMYLCTLYMRHKLGEAKLLVLLKCLYFVVECRDASEKNTTELAG